MEFLLNKFFVPMKIALMNKRYLFFMLLFSTTCIFGQNVQKNDSLRKKLNSSKPGIDYIDILLQLSKENSFTPDTAMLYANEAINESRIIGDSVRIIKGYNMLGTAQYNKGVLSDGIRTIEMAEKIISSGTIKNEKIKQDLTADLLNTKGVLLKEKGEYQQALSAYLVALHIREAQADSVKIAVLLSNIGSLLSEQNKISESLKYQLAAKKISEKIGDKNSLLYSLNDIGVLYGQMNNMDSAEFYFRKALQISKEVNLKMEGALLSNIGNIYTVRKNYNAALSYFQQALKIGEEMKVPMMQIFPLLNISGSYIKLNQKELALSNALQALTIAEKLNSKQRIGQCYAIITEVYLAKGDYTNAFNYEHRSSLMKDTLFNEKNSKQITEMQTKYETEKKEQQISLLNKESEIQELSIKKQKTAIYSVVGGLFLVMLFAIFIFRSLSVTKKQKHIISLQKEVVEQKNEELGAKNKQIADSIDYAQNIQQALLPSPEKIKDLLLNSFIFFQPRDVVSGDFYWLQQTTNEKNEKLVLFAAIDCTGHGVPGAFVSLMAYNFLEKVVNEHAIYNPEEILKELNKEVIQVLRKDGQITSTKYGMDMALVSWNKNTNKIIYAGARNPLYIISDCKLIQIEANRMSIGSTTDYSFVQHEIELKKEDMLYLFTDGFADQKGGTDGKKFYYPPFRELLERVSSMPAFEQKLILEKTFNNWKSNHQQTDDVLVMGIKI